MSRYIIYNLSTTRAIFLGPSRMEYAREQGCPSHRVGREYVRASWENPSSLLIAAPDLQTGCASFRRSCEERQHASFSLSSFPSFPLSLFLLAHSIRFLEARQSFRNFLYCVIIGSETDWQKFPIVAPLQVVLLQLSDWLERSLWHFDER